MPSRGNGYPPSRPRPRLAPRLPHYTLPTRPSFAPKRQRGAEAANSQYGTLRGSKRGNTRSDGGKMAVKLATTTLRGLEAFAVEVSARDAGSNTAPCGQGCSQSGGAEGASLDDNSCRTLTTSYTFHLLGVGPWHEGRSPGGWPSHRGALPRERCRKMRAHIHTGARSRAHICMTIHAHTCTHSPLPLPSPHIHARELWFTPAFVTCAV